MSRRRDHRPRMDATPCPDREGCERLYHPTLEAGDVCECCGVVVSPSVAGAPTGQEDWAKRNLARVEAVMERTDMYGDAVVDFISADDAYLAAHPEHVAPEVRAAILAPILALADTLGDRALREFESNQFSAAYALRDVQAEIRRAAGVESIAESEATKGSQG